jgi:hypothetical protein
MLEINNVLIPSPSTMKVGIMDISNAERNSKGNMLIDRVATKRKIDLSWRDLDGDKLAELLQLVDSVYFFVKYLDPMTNRQETRTFYVGDRNIGMFSYNNGNPIYDDISFNFIEK